MPQRGVFSKETALRTAFSVVLLSLSAVPLLGPVALFLSVAPQVMIARSRGIYEAFASWAVVLTAVYLMGGTEFLAIYALLFFCYGIWYFKVLSFISEPVGRIISAAAGWLVLAGILGLSANYLVDLNIIETIFINSRLDAGTLAARYIDMGMPEMQYVLENIIAAFLKGFSGIVAISALGGSWLVYLVLSGFGGEKSLVPLEKFRLPEELIWPLLGAAIFFLMGANIFSGGFLQMLGVNAGVVLLSLYFISGTGAAFFMMGRLEMNNFAKGALIITLILFLNGIYILTALGIADVWVNFRKRIGEKNKD